MYCVPAIVFELMFKRREKSVELSKAPNSGARKVPEKLGGVRSGVGWLGGRDRKVE